MKRILIMLGIGKQIDAVVLPETMIDAELAALTGRTPKTAAEKEFHRWLTTSRSERGAVLALRVIDSHCRRDNMSIVQENSHENDDQVHKPYRRQRQARSRFLRYRERHPDRLPVENL